MPVKKKKTKELISENKWLMSLPTIPRIVMGSLRYNLKEILMILTILLIAAWLLTSFGYVGGKVEIKPGVSIQYKKTMGESVRYE